MQSILRRPLRWLGYFALGCYVVLAVAIVGARYWLLPNIDQWREPVEQRLSQTLGLQVEMSHISAVWPGLYPRLRVESLQLRDDAGAPLLHIPRLEAVIGWQSLVGRRLKVIDLHAEGIELTVRRDARNGVQVLGREFKGEGEGDTLDGGIETNFLGWLADHGHVHLTHASVRWLDEWRGAPALELDDVTLLLERHGKARRLSMLARPPAELGRSFALQAHVELEVGADHSPRLDTLDGVFHVGVEGMRPAAWQPWLTAVEGLHQGEVSWHAWQEIHNGKALRHVTRIVAKDAVWSPGNGIRMEAATAQVHMDGPWAELKEIWLGKPEDETEETFPSPVVKLAMRVDGLRVGADQIFDAPLSFNSIALGGDASWEPATGLKLAAQPLQIRNADMDLELRGHWQELGGESAGMIDVEGQFNRAELPAIVRYLPRMVDEDAKEWMRYGLLAGTLEQAPLHLKGDVFHFPFGDRPDAGEFQLGGRVEGVIIDYAPEAAIGAPGWPRLEQLDGRAQLHNVDLQIVADTARMRPQEQSSISLRDVRARIPDIEGDAVLTVRGHGNADATSFLSLLTTTPLADLLDGIFDESKGKGVWEVPIYLTIPLSDTDATKVEGSVIFKDAELGMSPAFPVLGKLNGRVDFNEESVQAHDVKATVLGGTSIISGGLGKGHKGLDFAGSVQGEALDHYFDGQLLGRVRGSTPYRLSMQRKDGGAYGVSLQASLEGLLLDLPAPLYKPADRQWPLAMHWIPAAGKKPGTLDLNLGDKLTAQFLRRTGSGSATFFHAGGISVGGKVKSAADGMLLDVVASDVDIDGWRKLLDASSEQEAGGRQRSPSDGTFPPLRDIRIQAERTKALGTELNQFTFTARRPEGNRWRVDVSSTETAGTLFWQERQGRVEGQVDAHFERLAVGNASGTTAAGATTGTPGDDDPQSSWEIDGEINIPAIQLRVDRLKLYGREIGAVSVVGVNESEGRRWRLEQLEVSSPHASVKGSGTWQLEGANRGLRIEADALFDDLGSYLDQMGFVDLVQGGHGSIRGEVEWRGIPWKFERSALFGDLEVDLAKGRFLTVSSRSGRLLELLSLQSVKRLATREWNPTGLTQQGFPFDTLQGRIVGDAGVLHSENYRVTSPVATILMAGDVDLVREDLDVYAVVVPTLDVSGAAIAAGIAVNPIVGLGAFLTQWLLKDPVSKAMTVEYRVKGTFDDPKLVEINTKHEKAGGTK